MRALSHNFLSTTNTCSDSCTGAGPIHHGVREGAPVVVPVRPRLTGQGGRPVRRADLGPVHRRAGGRDGEGGNAVLASASTTASKQ